MTLVADGETCSRLVLDALYDGLPRQRLCGCLLTLVLVPHAYKAGKNNQTIRHSSGNGKVSLYNTFSPRVYTFTHMLHKPVIDYDLSRRYTDTWQAMEKLVDSGKARSIGTCPQVGLFIACID